MLVGVAEVWVVEDVEELSAETKPQFLGDVKLPLHPNICLKSSETPQHIAPEITCCPAGGVEKAARLKILPPGYCAP